MTKPGAKKTSGQPDLVTNKPGDGRIGTMLPIAPMSSTVWVFYFPEGGVRGSGPAGETLIGDSGWVGDISAPASFTARKVVPGGVSGGRLSVMRFVWLTMMRAAADIIATTAAITTGFRKLVTAEQRSDAGGVPTESGEG